MSWQDRLRESIKLVSPNGTEFTALWIGNPRSVEKKLGIFTYPKVQGADVQDLDIGADTYPLTIFFEGIDNDLDAARFFEACRENGHWQITHPVRGQLELQLVSVSEAIDPTGSANITRLDTEWIKPIIPGRIRSTQQLASNIGEQSNELNTSASSQFEKVFQDKFTEKASIEASINEITAAIKETLGPIYTTSANINSRMLSIYRSVQDLITQPILDVAGIAGQIQNLFQLPVLAIDDTKARTSAYVEMLAKIFETTAPIDDSRESYNISATRELSVTANITAMSQIAATSIGTIETRSQAIETAETISQAFIDATDGLDISQELFEDTEISDQYFSQSESFNDAALIIAQSVAYLLTASFELKKEKRFVLRVPKTPIAITIEEYGGLGENDENFDLFIKSNQLKANDILLLPAGREVVVYV